MILLGQLVAASVLLLDDNAVKDRLHILAVLGKVFMAQLRLLRRFCLGEALRLLVKTPGKLSGGQFSAERCRARCACDTLRQTGAGKAP